MRTIEDRLGILLNGGLQFLFRALPVRFIEHHPNICCNFKAHVFPGYMGYRVLLQVELAPLPGHTSQNCPASRSQAFMIIADHQFHPIHPALLQPLQEDFPVGFSFAQRHELPK